MRKYKRGWGKTPSSQNALKKGKKPGLGPIKHVTWELGQTQNSSSGVALGKTPHPKRIPPFSNPRGVFNLSKGGKGVRTPGEISV